jgi:hypothetical protein
MSGDTIDVSLTQQIRLLEERCPNIGPSIFPASMCPLKIDKLSSVEEHIDTVSSWLDSKNSESLPALAFPTKINYESAEIKIVGIEPVDKVCETLCSLERVMKAMVVGSQKEIGVLVARFSELNYPEEDLSESTARRRFVETYSLAYSIKVMLSNIPGLRVTMGGVRLPFPKTLAPSELTGILDSLKPKQKKSARVDQEASRSKRAKVSEENTRLAKMSAKDTKTVSTTNSSTNIGRDDDSEDSDDDDVEEEKHDETKKRKRKRGKR